MSKPITYPVTIDQLPKISITLFKIKTSTCKQYNLTLKRLDLKCEILANEKGGLFKLSHNSGTSWLIKLRSVRSNLGKSLYYHFICPITSMPCRNLYFYDGQFQHRNNIPINYKQQNLARDKRAMERIFRHELGTTEDEIMKKYFKTHYRGLPTKRFLRIMKRIQQEEEYYQNNALSIIKAITNQQTNITNE